MTPWPQRFHPFPSQAPSGGPKHSSIRAKLCQPRTFKSGERVFKPARTLYLAMTGLYRLRKNSCFVSGHDFSRALKKPHHEGFSP
jgi:hypothetical protein